jgi:hypothetical protein
VIWKRRHLFTPLSKELYSAPRVTKVVSKSLGLWIIPAEMPVAACDTVIIEWRQLLSA